MSDDSPVGPEATRGVNASERMLYNVSRQRMADVLLVCYFGGALFTSGVIGLLGPPETGTLVSDLLGVPVGDAYSWSAVLIGAAGLASRVFDSRRGDFYALIGVAVLTVLNAAILLPEHPQTAMRLLFSPALIVPYGWIRLGFVVSPREVYSLRAAIDRRREAQGRGEH